MADISEYGIRELVLDDERFVLYSAKDVGGELVLLKVARDSATPDDLSALSSDFVLARRCNIRSIPRPIRISSGNGTLCQVRQYVPGQPLSLWLESHPLPLSWTEALSIGILILEALEPLHARGFVHCDVSPRNLFYDAEGRAVYFADCTWARGTGLLSRRAPRSASPYLAPEQLLDEGGRVDARADIHAVGVIVYQMITGHVPPDGGAPESDPGLPPSVRPSLARLLDSDLDGRYRTAAAAKKSLLRCLENWRTQTAVPIVETNVDDGSDEVRFPEEVFGRRAVREALEESLQDAAAGEPTLVLMTGDGGSGKSTLVGHLRRVARRTGALVLSGGWGLFDRGIPLRGLSPLCEQIVEWLSTLDDSERDRHVDTLRAILGEGCGVVTEAFPVLERALGIHPPPAPAAPLERQNRLTYCFTALLAGLGGPDRPVVLLFEDLHWADEASLLMLQRLPGRASPRHLLTVGTVRTGLDGAASSFLSDLTKKCTEHGQTVRTLCVTPFEQTDCEFFLAGALAMRPEDTRALAVVLREMSLGNPLALRELLAEVAAQGMVTFDRQSARWSWRTQEIRRTYVPEDVGRIFASRISSLPREALETLGAAACVGARFTARSVGQLVPKAPAEVARALAACEQAGFVVAASTQDPPRGDGDAIFDFRHERIQSAAYDSLSATVQERLHAARGQILRSQYRESGRGDLLFEALTHLNRSAEMRPRQEDLDLAKLNYEAAVLAKKSMVYTVAAGLLRHMARQLERDVWTWDAELAFECTLLRAECAHLSKDTALAERTYDELLGRVTDAPRRIAVLMARSRMLTNLGRFVEAISDGIESLRLLGLQLPPNPGRAQTVFPMLRLMRLHARLPPEGSALELANLSPSTKQIMEVLAELWGPAFWVNENLTGLVVFAMVRLSLTHGNSAASAMAYGAYGVFLATALKRRQLGDRVCRLGVAVGEQASSPFYLGRARFMYEAFFGPYERSLTEAPEAFREIASACLRAGDYSYAGAAANMLLYYLPIVGIPLSDFGFQAREIIGAARQTEQSRTLVTVEILQRWIAVLEGREEAAAPAAFADALDVSNERGSENERGVYHLFEISLLYFVGDYRSTTPHIQFMPGNKMLGGYFASYYSFFVALVAAKRAETETDSRRWLKVFQRHRRIIDREAARCPQNLRHKSLLLSAIDAATRGQSGRAVSLFESAIADAHDHGFVPHAAIAAELLGEHFLRAGQPFAAEPHLRNARLWYHQWGCLRKVGAIDQQIAKCGSERVLSTPSITSEVATAWARDIGPVLEASRALSAETDPSRLADRLISAILEHTRATRVVLLTRDDGKLNIASERRAMGEAERSSTREVLKPDLPEAVINYVERLGRPQLLTASTEHELFGSDPYMRAHAGATLVCVPLVHMRQKLGVVFIEKDSPGSLRQSDVVAAEILAAQAAATLVNAREHSERLSALQNQIHPHFLFNALNGIAELTVKSPAEAEGAVLSLAALYRDILDASMQRTIPLKRELDLIRSYLALEKVRFGRRLTYSVEVSGDPGRALIPPLVLQPLVENSLKHGIERKPDGGTVTVTANIGEQRVHVRVADDGAGWGGDAKSRGAGFGLSAIRRRLQLLFGNDFDLSIDAAATGVKVDVFFPTTPEEVPKGTPG